jgi:hypothetical protein
MKLSVEDVLDDCLVSLDSLSSANLSEPTQATKHYEDTADNTESFSDHKIELIRTIELLKALVNEEVRSVAKKSSVAIEESAPKEALLDLQHRLRSLCVTPPAVRHSRASTANIVQLTEKLDSCRKTMVLYDDLDQASTAFDESAGFNCHGYICGRDVCDEYIESRYGNENIALPPPLKVLRTCWPSRRMETSGHLRHREKANLDTLRWQKGVMGAGGNGPVQSAFIRSKYLSGHAFIKVSAMLHTRNVARGC